MTPPHLHRSSGLLARSALVAVVLAGFVGGTAMSDSGSSSAGPVRTAILAGTDASPSALAAATSAHEVSTVRRTSGSLDTQATATRLAAEGYDTIIGIGAEARAAVTQAEAGEVGDGTSWRTGATAR
jgi:hypothetical protein